MSQTSHSSDRPRRKPNAKYERNLCKAAYGAIGKRASGKNQRKDLISACGVSRQSFYYYFSDIYDIVEWIFTEEADKALRDYSDIESWEFGYVLMMKWVLNHRALVQNTYNSIRRDYVEFFMNRVLYSYIIKVVEDAAVGMNVTNDQKRVYCQILYAGDQCHFTGMDPGGLERGAGGNCEKGKSADQRRFSKSPSQL